MKKEELGIYQQMGGFGPDPDGNPGQLSYKGATDGPLGEPPDGKLPDGEPPDGKLPDGEPPDGKDPEGKDPEGKAPDGAFPPKAPFDPEGAKLT